MFDGRAARLVEVSRDHLINEPKLQIRSTTYVSRVGFVSSLQTILLCLSEMEKITLNFMSHRKNQPPQMKKALLFIRNPFCRFYDRVYDGSRCTKKKYQRFLIYHLYDHRGGRVFIWAKMTGIELAEKEEAIASKIPTPSVLLISLRSNWVRDVLLRTESLITCSKAL